MKQFIRFALLIAFTFALNLSTLYASIGSGEENVKSIKKNELVGKLYPNPVKHVLNISFNIQLSDQVDILVLDMIGSIVKKETLIGIPASNETSIEMNDLENGVYFVQIQTKGTKESYRFIIRN